MEQKPKKKKVTKSENPSEIRELKNIMLLAFEEFREEFKKSDQRFEKIDQRFEKIDNDFEIVVKKLFEHDKEFRNLNKKLLEHDKKLSEHDDKFDKYHIELINAMEKIWSAIDDLRIESKSGLYLLDKQNETIQNHEERITFLEAKIS